jgi:uncharacterized protein (DUF1684 family)
MDFEQYQEELAAWRQLLDDSLRRENGWLALAGLFWLEEGDNAFGSDPANAVVVPGDVPAHLGVFRLTADTITLHVTPEADVRINGEKVQEAVLQSDSSGSPTLVSVGQVTMMVKKLEALYTIRMWDNGRAERHTFPGRQWYPVQERFRLMATFTPYEASDALTLTRSQGADFEGRPVGYVNFNFEGQAYSFLALPEGVNSLFLPFKDATNGQGTYKGGRYLRAELPQDGRAVVDFNRAYHPPCTFTPYAVCTLPPRQNWLDIAIEVGERL